MTTDDLPLLDLFMRLRKAGLRIGIDEYQLVLRAVQAGFGHPDREALARLCCTLWAKSTEDELLVNYHFEQVMSKPVSPPPATPSIPPVEPETKTTPPRINRYLVLALMAMGSGALSIGIYYLIRANQPFSNQIPKPESGTAVSSWMVGIAFLLLLGSSVYALYRWIKRITNLSSVSKPTTKLSDISSLTLQHKDKEFTGSPLPIELTQKIEDENQVAQAVRTAIRRDDEIPLARFLMTSDYLPVTSRQMQQSWRYLRQLAREGPPTELDLEATVNQISRQGLFFKPVLVPRQVNRTELLLLIDRDGSMVPFHSLSERLAETALRGDRLSRAGIYYFHNFPDDYLYRDPARLEAELVSDVFFRCRSQKTRVLIFSDAGAARGGLNPERIELTVTFLNQLRLKVRYVAWLNPMPRSRWLGTTAGEIARLLPMFEFSRRGLEDAISILRGKSRQYLKF